MTDPLHRSAHVALLGALWGRPPEDTGLASLTPTGWDEALALAGRHRATPLLHWRLRGTTAEHGLPASVRHHLEVAHRRSALRSLALKAELIRLHRLLEAEGIPHLALKGASLAFHTYPHPGLRPMRDLDLLVPADRVVAAFRTCEAAGYRRVGRGGGGDPEEFLVDCKHLPILRTPSENVIVELHHRLTAAITANGRTVLGEGPMFWSRARTRDFGGVDIGVPSDTDMLLHLLVHATYGHRFDNGPLGIADILFLLRDADVDWDLFWRMARDGGWARGCALGLELATRYDPDLGVRWPRAGRPAVPGDLIETSVGLTLTTPKHRLDRQLRARLARGGLVERARVLMEKAFPPRRVVARGYGVPATSLRVLTYYPAHWGRQIFRRAPSFLRMLRADPDGGETTQGDRLSRWLDGELADGPRSAGARPV